MKKWIKAFRLRTLPLSLACVGMGGITAAFLGNFSWSIMMLTILTTIFLQVLSNLANDYGDFVNGADHENRLGPVRSVQSGEIAPTSMKAAIGILILLSLLSGVVLLFISLEVNVYFLLFFILGMASIAAAIYYTMGSKPYGYAGLGDLSVFLFFGILAVGGTYYLHNLRIQPEIILPAISCGFFSVGVLNINNIRDIESDKSAGKRSIPVRIGKKKATFYQWFLILGGFITCLIFIAIHYISPLQFLFLITLPLFLKNTLALSRRNKSELIDPLLKKLAISTLLFVIMFGIGNLSSM